MTTNQNFLHLNDLCNLLNIKITHMFHRTLDSSWHFDNHINDYNRLYFVLDGYGYLYNEHERTDLTPYNIYLIPAFSSYNYRCPEYLEKLFIHFKLSIVPNRDLLSAIDHIVTIPSSKEELNHIKDIFYSENISSAVFIQDMIRRISFEQLKPHASAVYRDIDIYNKYRELYKYTESNLSAKLSVSEICRRAGFSQTYLGRCFKEDTGSTIKDYVTDMLTEKMKSMLQCGMPLRSIADDLDFGDIAYCSKFFKKHTGLSPREYAKKHVACPQMSNTSQKHGV